jgi:uncharacterized protein (TIRG00374 family)
MFKTKSSGYFVGGILSLFVIGIVLYALDWNEVGRIFLELNWWWLACAFLAHMTNYALRTRRIVILLDLHNQPFHKVYGIASLYGMYLYLLPAKSGEVTYPVLFKRNLNVSLTSGTAGLFVSRIFDFATIALFLPVIIINYWGELVPWIRLSSILFSGLMLGVIAGLLYLVQKPIVLNLPMRLKQGKGKIIGPNGFFAKLEEQIMKFVTQLRVIDEKALYLQLFGLTVGIWLLIQLNFFLIILSLGYLLTLFQIAVVSIIMVPITLLPIQGFANLGSHEIGWLTAFALFMMPGEIALQIAVSSHIILLFFVLLLGLIGYLLLKIQ